MTRSGAAADHVGYFHETAFYGSDDEFVDIVRPFLRGGLEAGEPTVVACAPHNTALLQRSLDCSAIRFLPAGDHYARPGPTVRTYRALFAELAAAGADQIRVIGDVPHPGTGVEWDAWMRYEAAVNVAYDDFPIWGLCPYDTRTAPADVLADVARLHPHVATADGLHRHNGRCESPAAFLAGRPGQVPIDRHPDVECLGVGARAARVELTRRAASSLGEADLEDLGLVVSELVTNAERHGRPPVDVRAWLEPGRVTVTVTDTGPGPADPLAGWRAPEPSGVGGRGLWIAHHLCTDLAIDRRDGCTVTFTIGPPRAAVS